MRSIMRGIESNKELTRPKDMIGLIWIGVSQKKKDPTKRLIRMLKKQTGASNIKVSLEVFDPCLFYVTNISKTEYKQVQR